MFPPLRWWSQCRVVCIQKQRQKTKGGREGRGRQADPTTHQLINKATDLHFPQNKKKETPGLLVSSSILSQKLVVPFFVCGRWVIITKRFLLLRQSITKRVLPSSRYVHRYSPPFLPACELGQVPNMPILFPSPTGAHSITPITDIKTKPHCTNARRCHTLRFKNMHIILIQPYLSLFVLQSNCHSDSGTETIGMDHSH